MEKLGKTLGLTTTGLLVVGGLTYAIVTNAKYIQQQQQMHDRETANGTTTMVHSEINNNPKRYLTNSYKDFITYWLNPPRNTYTGVTVSEMYGLRGGRF